MDNETEKLIAKHMNLLKISREEAIQLIEDDKRIDKGEKLFSLTPEQEKASKKARSAGRKPKTTVYKFDTTKRKKPENKNATFIDVTPHDIVKYGLIPEMVGRLPVIVGLEKLDAEALTRILREPKNSLIKQYVKLFKMDNLKLEITDGAVKKIAELAIARNAGARGLRSIMEEIMLPAMYEAPSMKDISGVKVDLDTVETKKIKYLKKEA